MPAYNRPIRIRTPKVKAEVVPTKVGAVIVFADGTDVAKAQRFLDSLVKRGIVSNEPYANEFNPDWGHPVWYVP